VVENLADGTVLVEVELPAVDEVLFCVILAGVVVYLDDVGVAVPDRWPAVRELLELGRLEALVDVTGVVVGIDRNPTAVDHWAGVDVLGHVVEGNPGWGVGEDRPHVGVGSPVVREVGVVEVDRAAIGNVEDVPRDDVAKARGDQQGWLEALDERELPGLGEEGEYVGVVAIDEEVVDAFPEVVDAKKHDFGHVSPSPPPAFNLMERRR